MGKRLYVYRSTRIRTENESRGDARFSRSIHTLYPVDERKPSTRRSFTKLRMLLHTVVHQERDFTRYIGDRSRVTQRRSQHVSTVVVVECPSASTVAGACRDISIECAAGQERHVAALIRESPAKLLTQEGSKEGTKEGRGGGREEAEGTSRGKRWWFCRGQGKPKANSRYTMET